MLPEILKTRMSGYESMGSGPYTAEMVIISIFVSSHLSI